MFIVAIRIYDHILYSLYYIIIFMYYIHVLYLLYRSTILSTDEAHVAAVDSNVLRGQG